MGIFYRFFAIVVLFSGLSLFAVPNVYAGTPIDKPVTFSDIYAHPDNPDLNLAYARQQAESGNFLAAASTLERMLFISPNWDSARLFYAEVLVSLDDKQGALRELDILENRPLSPEQKKIAKATRARITAPPTQSARKSDGKFHGRFAIGARYDDNAGNALSDNVLNPSALGDSALFAQGILAFAQPLQKNLTFHARLDGYAIAHQDFSNADMTAIKGQIGLDGTLSNKIDWRFDGDVSQISINNEKYLVETGGAFRLTKSLTKQTDVFGEARWHDQNYDNLSFAGTEEDRSGQKSIIDFGVERRVRDKTRISVRTGYEKKTARNAAFAYDGLRIQLDAKHRFDSGVSVRASGKFRKLSYDMPVLIGTQSIDRNDDRLSGRIAVSASFDKISQWMGAAKGRGGRANTPLRHVSAEIGAFGFTRSSSINSFNYDNKGVDLRLIWDF